MNLADVQTEAQALAWWRAQWKRSEFVATALDELQYEAASGLIRFPDLVHDATAHLFDGPDPLYAEIFRAVKAGARGLEQVYIAVSRRQRSMASALPLADMSWHPVTRWNAARAISQLKRLVAWQYRQIKAKAQRVAA